MRSCCRVVLEILVEELLDVLVGNFLPTSVGGNLDFAWIEKTNSVVTMARRIAMNNFKQRHTHRNSFLTLLPENCIEFTDFVSEALLQLRQPQV